MAGEYAPDAILDLYDRIAGLFDSAQLSGVIGDQDHRYGYHRARAVLPSADYSVQVPEDKRGDPWACSALDVSLNAADMATVTSRLLASAKDPDDPRLNYCREFYGTTDGRSVTGWDTYFGHPATSDASHLWHVHISFLRQFSNDSTAMDAVYSVIAGHDVSEGDMEWTDPLAGTPDYPGRTCKEAWTDIWYRAQHDLPTLVKEIGDVQRDLDGLKAAVAEILNRLPKK